MIFYVLEFQTTNGSGAVIPTAYTDRPTAEAAYHQVLAAAAQSSVYKHGAMLCNEDMFVLKQEVYTHYPVQDEDDPT